MVACAIAGMAAPASTQVQTLTYASDKAVPVAIAPGYATVVELAPDERVENVVVGDSTAWQVTPTKRGDRLVIKPTGGNPPSTDLVVMTTARRYIFLLGPASGSEGGSYVLRFDYPDLTPVIARQSGPIVEYRFSGDETLYPQIMVDDGAQTTISWKADTPLPAVYAVDRKGHEALVNGRMVGATFVIEGTSPRYVFRRDKAKAVATRQPARAIR